MSPVKRILDVAVDLAGVAAGLAVSLMMLHVTIDIVLRFLFDAPLTGTITFVSHYYMVFLVCLPLAFVERADGHIAVDVVTDRLPERWSYHLRHIALIPSAAVVGLVAYATWDEAVGKYQRGTFLMEQGLEVPIWIGYFALPLGYGLMALYLLLKFAGYLQGRPITSMVEASTAAYEGTVND